MLGLGNLYADGSVLRFYWSTELSGSMKTAIIIFIFLAVFFIVMGIKFSKMDPDKDPVPTKGIRFLCVVLVDTINKFVDNQLPTVDKKIYAPYLMGIASYLTLANIASCYGLTPPFTNLALALSLSVLAFIIFEFTSFKYQGAKEKFKGMLGPMKQISFLMFPINLVGEFTTPFSMGMRLFGNIFSGVILAGIILGICESMNVVLGSILSTALIAALFHPIFDIFFGVLQMYVYYMLTTMFIKQNL